MSEKRTFGLIYKHAWLYQLAMRILYRGDYGKKYELVAEQVPEGASVVDLCCGDCQIYPLLKRKGCDYIGLDINPSFVQWGRDKGIEVRLWDVEAMDIPEADVICIQSALYHFIPHDKKLLERMLSKARKRVIISEPVDNWTQIALKPLHRVAIMLTQVSGKSFAKRHNEESLAALLKDIPEHRISRVRIPRELIIVINK